MCEFKVSETLLVSFKHEHAAPEVVVDSCRVHGISSEPLLSYLSCLQVATEGPGRFIGVEKDGTESAEGESLVGVVVDEIYLLRAHVAREGDVVFAARLIN